MIPEPDADVAALFTTIGVALDEYEYLWKLHASGIDIYERTHRRAVDALADLEAAFDRLAARLESRERELWDTGKSLSNAGRRLQESERERDEAQSTLKMANVDAMRNAAQRDVAEAREKALLEALALCNGDDIRLNGCACTTEKACYLHAKIVAPLLADDARLGNAILEVTRVNALASDESGEAE